MSTQSVRRTVILVQIEEEDGDVTGMFENMYADLLLLLKTNPSINLVIVKSMSELQGKLLETKARVMLLMNELVALKKTKKIPSLFDTVFGFICGGGLVVLGAYFSSFAVKPDMNYFFSRLGLSWEFTEYNRAIFGVTDVGRSLLNLSTIKQRFSVKAVQLKNVDPAHRLFTPVAGGMTTSRVSTRTDQSKLDHGCIR